MKKTIYCFLCFTILPVLLFKPVYAQDRQVVTFEVRDGAVTGEKIVTVRLERQPNYGVYLTVLAPNDPPYMLENVASANSLSIVRYAGQQTESNKDGSYTFNVYLGEDPDGGWYQLKIGAVGFRISEEQRTGQFYYASAEERDAAISALNNATEENIGDVLKKFSEESPVLSINLNGDYLFVEKEAQKIILNLRAEKSIKAFNSVSEIETTFDIAVGISMINKSEDGTTVNELLYKYEDILTAGAGITGQFESDYINSKEKLGALLILDRKVNSAKNGYQTLSEFKEALWRCLAIATVNNTGRESMTGVLERYNFLLGLDLTGTYNSLDRIEVNKFLANKDFKYITEIKTAFDNGVAFVLGQVGKNQNSQGGGGGGGGNVKTTSVTIVSQEHDVEFVPYVPVAESRFSDLNDVEWARDSIEALAELNVINGMGDGLFQPNDNVTREQFVKMIIQAFGIIHNDAVCTYVDVSIDDWFYQYISIAQSAGIVNGVSETEFGVGRSILRQEMSVLMYRMIEHYGQLNNDNVNTESFLDDGEIDDYAKNAIRYLQGQGIISGTGNGMFTPKSYSTRAEAAKLVYDVIKVLTPREVSE